MESFPAYSKDSETQTSAHLGIPLDFNRQVSMRRLTRCEGHLNTTLNFTHMRFVTKAEKENLYGIFDDRLLRGSLGVIF